MADPYSPPLSGFVFSPAEIRVITLALASKKPWDYEPATIEERNTLKEVKDKILHLHLQRHGWTCCYCRANLQGAGPFMTDREHILPKSKAAYKALSYKLWNLGAACKRCNMQFKGSDDSFVIHDPPVDLLAAETYRIIHPNFDLWEDHLTRITVQVNAKTLVKFSRKGSAKSMYTYEFFNLRGLEIDSFDGAQGLDNVVEESVAVSELRNLAKAFNQ